MRGIRAAVSMRTRMPGDFYLLFPELVTLGFIFADGKENNRLELNGKRAYQILPILGRERCIERFKGDELSIQLGHDDAQPISTGSLLVTKNRARPFMAVQLPASQRFVYIDLLDWKLADIPPDALCEVHSDWRFMRGWDCMLVHDFRSRTQMWASEQNARLAKNIVSLTPRVGIDCQASEKTREQ